MKDQTTNNSKTHETALLRNSSAVEDIPYLLDENVPELTLLASCAKKGSPAISLVASCGDDSMTGNLPFSSVDENK